MMGFNRTTMKCVSIKHAHVWGVAASLALSAGASAGDFNGDGFDDLAIGVPGDNANAGSVNVVYGAPVWGLSVVHPIALTETALGGASAAGDEFGYALAIGDFNHDGFDDLAIGAPNKFGGAGLVRVVYGAPGGLNAAGACPSIYLILGAAPVPGAPGGVGGDRFGHALVAGDFNGDLIDDLAIGAPDDDNYGIVGIGSVCVVYGQWGCGGFGPGSYLDSAALGVAPAAGDHFGVSLAAGNFDPCAGPAEDLAIGADLDDIGGSMNEGSVHVAYGNPAGIWPPAKAPDHWYHASLGLGPGVFWDWFGRALAAGDFNGDGKDDLAIGIPGWDQGAILETGKVAVIFGKCVGGAGGLQIAAPAPQVRHQSTANVPEIAGAFERFGSSLVAANFDRDLNFLTGRPIDDLAIGTPWENRPGAVNNGFVTVLYGSASAFLVIPAAGVHTPGQFDQNLVGKEANAPNEYQGSSLAAGDWNGDGFMDLAWGTPSDTRGAAANAGYVNTVYGGGPAWGELAVGAPVAPQGFARNGAGGTTVLPGGLGAGDLLGSSVSSNR